MGPGAMPCLTYYAIAQKIIAEKADCSQSAVWKHVTGKGTEQGNVVRKGAEATGMTSAFRGRSKKVDSNPETVHQESP